MFATLDSLDTLGLVLSFFFTILVLLYAFGDNVFFRLAIHIFIGVAAGYAGAVALRDVLIPRVSGLDTIHLIIAAVLIVLLVLKISPKTAFLGNPVSGLLVGVGAAIAIGGAIQGTLIPQVAGAANFYTPELLRQSFQTGDLATAIRLMFEGSLVLLGTITTLIHFHFSVKHVPNQIPQQPLAIRVIGWVGQAFIAITFGVLFAGIYSATLVALIERFYFIKDFILNLSSLLQL
jgi:hypothetical protein